MEMEWNGNSCINYNNPGIQCHSGSAAASIDSFSTFEEAFY